MINTYNETNLHAKLKELYILETNGKGEVKLDDTAWICDIISENGNILEIQTANLSALTEKVKYILSTNRKIKIVHPVAQTKWIELYDSDEKLIYRKKSPKKASIFDSLRGMTKICSFLIHENLTLEVLYCEITEKRKKTSEPSQLKNNSRRHLKNWIPIGKSLDKILEKKVFSTKSDWLTLIPSDLHYPFRTVDLEKSMKNLYGAKNSRWAKLLIWLFMQMNIIHIEKIQGRSKFYTVS